MGAAAGSIPAWAGETLRPRILLPTSRVYPRVGGGNTPAEDFAAYEQGLSPRGRGKPEETIAHDHPARSIPAWAGETLIRRERR